MKHPGYVYVLHFDVPLHHARHYTGSTPLPIQRLAQHRAGTGSRITQVLQELGTTWTLATIIQTPTIAAARRLERRIKRCKNGPRYCKICTPGHPTPAGTLDIPPPLIEGKTNVVHRT